MLFEMRIKIGILLIALGFSGSASAVETVAGGLRNVVADTSVSSLVVTGQMDASDFDFICSEMSELKSLDISGVSIVAYEGEPVLPLGKQSYRASEIPAYAFMGMELESVVLPETVEAVGESAFASTAIVSLDIPESVKSIGMGAFSNCDALESVTIPASVTEIGEYAWSGCDNLAGVEMGAGVTVIEASTFARCVRLESVTLPSALAEISDAAFSGCISLTGLVFPASLAVIGDNAFEQSGLAVVDLSQCDNLAKIGDWAFARCANLTTVYLGENFGGMGEGVFFDDASLAVFATPIAVTEMPAYMLKGAMSLDGAGVIHGDVEAIGDYALMGLGNVTEITLPSSLAYIGDNAMEGWTSLTSIDGASLSIVPGLGENVWSGVEQSSVVLKVDGNMANAFKSTDQWQEFNITIVTETDEIVEDANVDVYAYFDGYDLVIKSVEEMAEISLYDVQGRQQAYITPENTMATVDTSGMAGNFFIVRILHGDGSSATLKVVRKA